MPTYEYDCPHCGPFTAMRRMAECEQPNECPECGENAPRAFLTAPAIPSLSAESRLAFSTNERSSNAPKTLAEHKASRHGAGCSCCGGGSKRSRPVVRGKDGSKSFPSSRPWMISH